jgi:hypothetical protein
MERWAKEIPVSPLPNLHTNSQKATELKPMNQRSARAQPLQLAALAILAGTLLIVLQTSAGIAWFQSPISPLAPTTSPVLPQNEPPLPLSAEGTGPRPHMFVRNMLSSPWPWAAVGIVGFGALSWGFVSFFGRAERDK